MQSDGTCKKQCIATAPSNYIDGSTTDTCDHNVSTQVSWTNGQVVADNYCNNVHSCVDVFRNSSSQGWSSVWCRWPMGDHWESSNTNCAIEADHKVPAEYNTDAYSAYPNQTDSTCEYLTFSEMAGSSNLEALCDKEGGSCLAVTDNNNQCADPIGPEDCPAYELLCTPKSQTARHGTWTFNWAQ